jgi:hypothetical protein
MLQPTWRLPLLSGQTCAQLSDPPGNSNPRAKDFERMNTSIRARHHAYSLLLEASQIRLSESTRSELVNLWAAEEMRFRGKTAHILARSKLRLVDRAAMARCRTCTLRHPSRFYSLFPLAGQVNVDRRRIGARTGSIEAPLTADASRSDPHLNSSFDP